jgi:hypothetical protein
MKDTKLSGYDIPKVNIIFILLITDERQFSSYDHLSSRKSNFRLTLHYIPYAYGRIYLHVFTSMNACVCLHMFVYMCIYKDLYLRMDACMRVCMYIYIRVYIQRVHKVRKHFKLFIAQELQIIQISYTCHFEEKL